MEPMNLPRLLLTPNLMGRPLGLAGDAKGQHLVLSAAFDLLEMATGGGTIIEFLEKS